MSKETCQNFKRCEWGFCMYQYYTDDRDCKESCYFDKFNTKENEGENDK